MKTTLVIFMALMLTLTSTAKAENLDVSEDKSVTTNNWGSELKNSPIGIGLDLQTKYVWRGMEMMTMKSSPILFPSINYSWKGFFVYAMGGYALNGEYAEVDFGISYTWRGLTIGFNDYYYPTIDTNEDNYFSGKNTGHWMEAIISYTPDKMPFWITASTFFNGPDNYVNTSGEERQAYSSYVEIGTYYDFLDNNKVSLAVGAALNKSCYNVYDEDFSICNIEGKYTYNVKFKNDWSLPLSVSFIYNPVFDKSFINFTANIAF